MNSQFSCLRLQKARIANVQHRTQLCAVVGTDWQLSATRVTDPASLWSPDTETQQELFLSYDSTAVTVSNQQWPWHSYLQLKPLFRDPTAFLTPWVYHILFSKANTWPTFSSPQLFFVLWIARISIRLHGSESSRSFWFLHVLFLWPCIQTTFLPAGCPRGASSTSVESCSSLFTTEPPRTEQRTVNLWVWHCYLILSAALWTPDLAQHTSDPSPCLKPLTCAQ